MRDADYQRAVETSLSTHMTKTHDKKKQNNTNKRALKNGHDKESPLPVDRKLAELSDSRYLEGFSNNSPLHGQNPEISSSCFRNQKHF